MLDGTAVIRQRRAAVESVGSVNAITRSSSKASRLRDESPAVSRTSRQAGSSDYDPDGREEERETIFNDDTSWITHKQATVDVGVNSMVDDSPRAGSDSGGSGSGGGGGGAEVVIDEHESLSVENVIEVVTRMGKGLERIVQTGVAIPPEALAELRSLHEELTGISGRLKSGTSYVDDRSDVDALVDFRRLAWNFNNPEVDAYRSIAVKERGPLYPKWEFQAWNLPEYFSNSPLPPDTDTAKCQVSLPLPPNTSMRSTAVILTSKDTCKVGISQAFKAMRGGGGREDQYVFKAKGQTEYMLPHRLFYSYQYVRDCLRDGQEIQLALVEVPPLRKDETGAPEAARLYASKGRLATQMDRLITETTHADALLTAENAWYSMSSAPMAELSLPLRVRLCGLDHLSEEAIPRLHDHDYDAIYLAADLFHGAVVLARYQTAEQEMSVAPRWFERAVFPFLCAIPREARLAVRLVGRVQQDKGDRLVVLAYVVHQLVDVYGVLTAGFIALPLWGLPSKAHSKGHKKVREDPDFIFRATNRPNLAIKDPCVLRLGFDEYELPVVAPLEGGSQKAKPVVIGQDLTSRSKQQKATMDAHLEALAGADPLSELTQEDKLELWANRTAITDRPQLLAKFLQSVDWGNRAHKLEALDCLKRWAPPEKLVYALELLDCKFPDYSVRKYAVDLLAKLKDEELQLYLLQFTQTLKFEPYHDSPLSRFLIERALRNPYVIGHHFFWHLKAELHDVNFTERFGVILEEYLSNCGRYAQELRKQNHAVLKLQRVAEMIVRITRDEGVGKDVGKREYVKELRKLNRTFFGPMGKFHIPLDPKWEATTLVIDKCRYMSSKMVPLWLVFNNADDTAPPIYIMFKSGDDLRQDILTLQMLRVMDAMWLQNGLDMRLKPYKCVATGVNEHGEGVGMLEIVLNSDTTSGIQVDYGGGAMGALKLNPIDLFLRHHNKGEAAYEVAVENFLFSCAGYCVATFVMGIGDRHNGNIMVTKDGHLFHIDFGHFLGNFKSKFGVKRERAAFVFTPEMAFVMGGKKFRQSAKFQQFMDSSSRAYAILRENAALLEILFVLMVAAGMPELLMESDIHYLREMLHLECDAKKADKRLKKEMDKSLSTTFRRVDNMIHNFKHG